MGTKILIPVDGSELAEAALPYAERIGAALGWGAVLLCVVSPAVAHDRPPGHAPIEAPLEQETQPPAGYEAIREEEAAAEERLEAVAARLRAAGLQAEPEVANGDPRDVIAERADEADIAMIVMASHGRTGLARLFRGSVAAAVVERTNRPALLVRPFRDADSRLDFEHAEQLPGDQAEAVRRAIESVPS